MDIPKECYESGFIQKMTLGILVLMTGLISYVGSAIYWVIKMGVWSTEELIFGPMDRLVPMFGLVLTIIGLVYIVWLFYSAKKRSE